MAPAREARKVFACLQLGRPARRPADRSSSLRKVEGADVDGVNPYVVVDGVGMGVGGGDANEDDNAVDASSLTESRTLFR